MPPETCEKHDDCMKDLRDDIHSLDKSSTKVEGIVQGFIQATQDYINASRKDIYGKEGLVTRVGSISNQVTLQWGIIVIILIAVVAKVIKG